MDTEPVIDANDLTRTPPRRRDIRHRWGLAATPGLGQRIHEHLGALGGATPIPEGRHADRSRPPLTGAVQDSVTL